MNYIGSKKSLLEFIEKSISRVVKEKDYKFSDLFAWTWIVWRYFKEKWHSVISNDLQYYSYVINKNYVWNHKKLKFEGLSKKFKEFNNINIFDRQNFIIDHLDNIKWKKWFIFKNYSFWWTKWEEHERLYFSDDNALKCDSIRSEIEKWKKEELINDNEYYFLLTSLLEWIDKVANTASVYGAFLKKLKKSAQKLMLLKPAEFYLNDNEHAVYNSDVNTLIKHTAHDVVYLDPPYNQRQYSGNYHILETIAKNDNPSIKWKTWMRDCSNQKSLYCKKSEVKNSFRDIIQTIDAKYVFLSYNCEWLMSHQEIKEIMSERGKYWVFTKKYRRYKADTNENRQHKKDSVLEYLHYVKIK